jgi:two-component system response regulator HydG
MRVNQVLLIDDENATRLVMTSRLLQAGYEVAAADNGALGINLARERRFDLILIAANLSSGVGGLEVCRRMRQIPRNIGVPLILMSKSSARDELPQGYEAGADACLVKSDLPLLEQVLKVFLRFKADRDESLHQARALADQNRKLQEERQRNGTPETNGQSHAEPAHVWREIAASKPDGVMLVDDDGFVRCADIGAQDIFDGSLDGVALSKLAPATGFEAFVRDASVQTKDGQRFDLAARAGRASRSILASVVPMVVKPGEADPGMRVVILIDAARRKVATEMIRLQEYTLPRREVGVLLDVARVAYGLSSLIGPGAAMTRIRAKVTEAAKGSQPVLIVGESGSGRQHVARALHYSGDGAGNPFLPIACAGLSEEHLEAEIFGQVKGATPEASDDRPGAMQQGKGTLYLQDVEQLSAALQQKLLRAIREGVVCRAGTQRTEPTEMRVVAATSVDLNRSVADGTFDADLLRALAGSVIVVPSLRERAEDVDALTLHFLRMFGSGRAELEVAPEAMARIHAHAWPGNVLELKTCIDRACKRAPGNLIGVEHLPPAVRDAAADVPSRELLPSPKPTKLTFGGNHVAPPTLIVPAAAPSISLSARPGEIGPEDPISLDHYERKCLERALEATGGDKIQAARLLKVGKSTLYRKLKRYEIS